MFIAAKVMAFLFREQATANQEVTPPQSLLATPPVSRQRRMVMRPVWQMRQVESRAERVADLLRRRADCELPKSVPILPSVLACRLPLEMHSARQTERAPVEREQLPAELSQSVLPASVFSAPIPPSLFPWRDRSEFVRRLCSCRPNHNW